MNASMIMAVLQALAALYQHVVGAIGAGDVAELKRVEDIISGDVLRSRAALDDAEARVRRG